MNNKKLFQIGVPVEELSVVCSQWFWTQPREKFLVSPSKKDADVCVIETRDALFASSVAKTLERARVKIVECEIKTVTI